MYRVDRSFIGLAVLNALCGMALGLWMSRANDYTLVPLHAHLNLLGWLTFAVFGLAYRTGIARQDRWAVVHLWVSAAAILVFSVGIAVALLFGRPQLVYGGAALVVASMLLFGVNVARAALHSLRRRLSYRVLASLAERRRAVGDAVAADDWQPVGPRVLRLGR